MRARYGANSAGSAARGPASASAGRPGNTFDSGSHAEHYRPLPPLLWSLALNGPRAALLPEIAGTAAYRALRNPADDGLPVSGALRPTVDRLRQETVSLPTISRWPGMSVARASRLLNGLYLTSALLATRVHPAAHAAPTGLRSRLADRWRRR